MVLGLSEWYKQRDEQLLKETSLLFYYLERYRIIRYIITILWFTALSLTSFNYYLIGSWAVSGLLVISYSFWVQHKLDKRRPTAEESLEQYKEYRKSVNCPI